MITENIGKIFELPLQAMEHMVESFHIEMDRGLSGEKSSLKMIPTYAGMPTGEEKGIYMALDMGGTNFRVLQIELKGGRKTGRPSIMKFVLGKEEIAGTAEQFFDFIAESVKTFLKKQKHKAGGPCDLGFTFSFPIQQTSAARGILICWTKGFQTSGVVGKDVVGLLGQAFRRKGVEDINISALVNDTVGTLVAKSYADTACDVGVIIGTGTNACYPEELRKIKKLRGAKPRRGRMIINIEWGNFNKLASTHYDRQLDEESENSGQQILEKMVSGMYLGEIARLILHEAAIEGSLSCGLIPFLMKRKSFEAEHMSLIEGDKTGGLKLIGALLAKSGLRKFSVNDRRVIKKVCETVSRRAARISASCIAAIVTKIDPKLSRAHTIAIDGSLFERHPTFSTNMEAALKEILGRKASLVKLTLAKDGSGKGAAIIAAVAAKR
jgi:hexokinase